VPIDPNLVSDFPISQAKLQCANPTKQLIAINTHIIRAVTLNYCVVYSFYIALFFSIVTEMSQLIPTTVEPVLRHTLSFPY
jgi:hypothetical protein